MAIYDYENQSADFGSSLLDLFDFSDMLLNIEIDTKEWVGKSAKEKLAYLKRELGMNNSKKLFNVATKLAGGICSLIRYNTSNPIINGYIGLAETALGLSKATAVLNNAFISSTIDIKSDYDAIAHFMGLPSGQSIAATSVEVTPEICKAFISMPKEAQQKYKIEFTKVQSSSDASSTEFDEDNEPEMDNSLSEHLITTYIMASAVTRNGAVGKIGIELGYMTSKRETSDINEGHSYSYCNVCVANTEDIAFFDILEEFEEIIYGTYIDSIDISKNLIKIDNGILYKTPRVDIDFDVHNFDLEDTNGNIIRTLDSEADLIRTVLNHGHRRGYIIQGEPGTGKTISINKLLMKFTDSPVFWITASSVSDTNKMHSVFRILNMFPGSIFVFDDFDGNDFSSKNPLTTTFISCIDETTSPKFSGILFLIINEPQSLHNTIKFRSGRIDDIIYVKNPETVEQIEDIVTQRFNHMRASNPEIEKPDWVSSDNEEFATAAKIISDGHLTHAHIGGIVRDLVELNEQYDCKKFIELIERRMTSISNGKLVAYEDGHIGEQPANYNLHTREFGRHLSERTLTHLLK